METIKLQRLETNHLVVMAKINNIEGNFIVDTGSAITCVHSDLIDMFKMAQFDFSNDVVGVGEAIGQHLLYKENDVSIGQTSLSCSQIMGINLTNVNEVLKLNKCLPICGIIGADVLIRLNASIDYSHNVLKIYQSYLYPF